MPQIILHDDFECCPDRWISYFLDFATSVPNLRSTNHTTHCFAFGGSGHRSICSRSHVCAGVNTLLRELTMILLICMQENKAFVIRTEWRLRSACQRP